MSSIFYFWDLLLVNPLLNSLMFFYHFFNSNMGVAIIALSVFIKLITTPFTQGSLKAIQKQRELMPHIEELKKKYGHNKEKLAAEQLKLYKEAGINPASGCLTQILPILVTIALFSVISGLYGDHARSIESLNAKLYFENLKVATNAVLNSKFLYMDLSKPDHLFILPVLSAVLQFLTSKLMMPKVDKAEKLARKTDDKKDDVMYNMQEQMLYTAPIIFLIVGVKLPSGVVLNILVTTLFSFLQQWYISKFSLGKKV